MGQQELVSLIVHVVDKVLVGEGCVLFKYTGEAINSCLFSLTGLCLPAEGKGLTIHL